MPVLRMIVRTRCMSLAVALVVVLMPRVVCAQRAEVGASTPVFARPLPSGVLASRLSDVAGREPEAASGGERNHVKGALIGGFVGAVLGGVSPYLFGGRDANGRLPYDRQVLVVVAGVVGGVVGAVIGGIKGTPKHDATLTH